MGVMFDNEWFYNVKNTFKKSENKSVTISNK